MVGLYFKDFLDLEKGDTTLGQPKLNWKKELHGIRTLHRIFRSAQCDNDKTYKQCELSLKFN